MKTRYNETTLQRKQKMKEIWEQIGDSNLSTI